MILSGFNHFRIPKKYEKFIPDYFPAPSSMVLLSGIIEMVLGLMLITEESQHLAGWGIILISFIYLLVPLFMLNKSNDFIKYPKWIWLVCILLQFMIMSWASLYI